VAGLGLLGAIAIALGLLIVGWLVYDRLWSSPLARNKPVATLVSFALLVAAAFGLSRAFSGRAAYLLLGATLGTIMAANVWRIIIPAQTRMLASTRAGTPVDVSLGERAKLRSTHNHYLTLPVLFTMLSNHFPSTYGHPLNWLVLVLMVLAGAVIKYVMNLRGASNRWIVLGGTSALVAAIALTAQAPAPTTTAGQFDAATPVSFETARAIIERRCITCHAAHPTNPSFPQPPSGIVLEEPRRIRTLAPRILVRAVVTRTMPLGNLTGMTDEERAALGAWIAQGAKID
jgi:uncharacterized membrane protein